MKAYVRMNVFECSDESCDLRVAHWTSDGDTTKVSQSPIVYVYRVATYVCR